MLLYSRNQHKILKQFSYQQKKAKWIDLKMIKGLQVAGGSWTMAIGFKYSE